MLGLGSRKGGDGFRNFVPEHKQQEINILLDGWRIVAITRNHINAFDLPLKLTIHQFQIARSFCPVV